jgi:superfamily II DNA/RNA helicase
MRFSELNLEPSLFSAIQKLGYEECTPIQSQTMGPVLEGRDVAGLAQTGTGKTAAFLIPLMDRILKGRVNVDSLPEEQKELLQKRAFQDWRAQNFILVLVPTRELAEQVQENILRLSMESGLKGFAIYGGTSYDRQKDAVKAGLEFIVATPGRLIDLYKEHVVDLKQVRAVVFDEADRMFDMGFKDDMKYILERIPKDRQFLVFSATLNFDVLNTAYQFGADPVEINVSLDQSKAENVKDELFHVGDNDKAMYLLSLLKKYNPKQAIIFSNFKFSVERIARFLSENGVPAMGISSLLTQAQRTRVMEQFRAENEKNILVATDVAARGLDIKGVDLVINFELPMDAESYVHRIGRTGRAGAEGRAISLASDRDVESLSRIEDYLKHKIEIGWIEDSDLIRDFKMPAREHDSYQDRGPRREGGGDRGPRREGGRPPRGGDRGPRREGGRDGRRGGGEQRAERGDRGPSAGGPRPQGQRPPRQDRGPRDGNRDPQREGQREAGARPDQEGRPPRQGQNRSGGPRPDFKRGQANGNGNGNGNGRGPHSRPGQQPTGDNKGRKQFQRPPGGKPQQGRGAPPPASITQKVSGFFKKIFGG